MLTYTNIQTYLEEKSVEIIKQTLIKFTQYVSFWLINKTVDYFSYGPCCRVSIIWLQRKFIRQFFRKSSKIIQQKILTIVFWSLKTGRWILTIKID